MNPAVLLITGVHRALSPASHALRRNKEKVSRTAGCASRVITCQASEIAREAAIGERIPPHLYGTGDEGQALIVDSDEAGVGAKAGIVRV